MKGGGGGGGGGNYHHQIHSYNKSSKPSPPIFYLPKLMVYLLLFLSFLYFLYTLSLFLSPSSSNCSHSSTSLSLSSNSNSNFSRISIPTPITNTTTTTTTTTTRSRSQSSSLPLLPKPSHPPTDLSHIVFGIAASASLWDKRQHYLKIWWRPQQMRGFVWLDKPVPSDSSSDSSSDKDNNDGSNQEEDDNDKDSNLLPQTIISGETSEFHYTHRQGHRSAIRISRIVSETFRLDLPDVHWFVMGDDDTVFLPDNLLRVLSQYDHRQHYYIGSSSESHLQNIYFSYSMAYGGGGFAISRPLAAAVDKMQDGCLQRYPGLYGSDDRIQACMAELGVPLTRHSGFHQYDVYGDLLGLLAAHPVTPLVSLHHLDKVEPIFPRMSRAGAVRKLFESAVRLDSAGVMQQSICYESERRWTVSVSWGFVVQVVRGIMSPREMAMPARTFLNWYKRADYTAYAFNTRPVARNPCQRPFVFYLEESRLEEGMRTTVIL